MLQGKERPRAGRGGQPACVMQHQGWGQVRRCCMGGTAVALPCVCPAPAS